MIQGVPNDELHFGEKWFHGKLARGREEAEELLRRYSHLSDGTFLVRQCVTFVGDYCLSFWRKGKVNHCRIKLKQEMGQTQYYLIDTNCFDSLYSLITYYRSHPLRSQVRINNILNNNYFCCFHNIVLLIYKYSK